MDRCSKSGQVWVRGFRDAFEGEEGLLGFLLLPAQAFQLFPHSLLTDPDSTGNLAIGMSLPLETVDQSCPRSPETSTSSRVSAALPQRAEAAVLEPPLMTSQGPCRAAEA